MDFHAHIYYDRKHREQALQLHSQLKTINEKGMIVYSMVDRLVGPHLAPMFEIEFSEELYEPLIAYLEDNRGDLPVLIHPLTEDEIANHGVLARWLGQKLPINWARLQGAA